jgi:iron(III) transport system ATP-binding protein
LLELRNLTWSVSGNQVLRGINLQLGETEILTILGESGSGKTSLLRLVAGLEVPSGGEIRLAGKPISTSESVLPAANRGIALVPQEGALFPHLSVAANIGFGLHRMSRADRVARVGDMLSLVSLDGLQDRRPAELSGGQQQRVALARALAVRPKLVLLDEPFSALDPALREALRRDVVAVLKRERVAAIMVTHDRDEALSISDRVALLMSGEIVQQGQPAEIYRSPANLGLASFLGESVVVRGEVVADKIRTDLGLLTPLNKATPGATGSVAIRSENFYIQPNPKGDSEVLGTEFFGHDALVTVQTPKLKIRARASGPFAPQPGMRVTVWVRGAVNFYPDPS